MEKKLEALYEARRRALTAEAEVLDADDDRELASRLQKALQATDELPKHERSFRLQVIASLLAKVNGVDAAKLLLRILGDDDESVQASAVGALIDFKSAGKHAELCKAVEHVLDGGYAGGGFPALPGILLQNLQEDEDPPIDLLVRLLDHDDADVAAEAACALWDVGAEGTEELLSSFVDDERPLTGTDGGETLGDLILALLESTSLAQAMGTPVGEA
ncbi:MAG: hypothetical protein AAGF12_28170 [Myxococcota bacterium]